ncbi:MAG: hypothetical protein V7642_741 [Burkholderiales bacterium]
MQGMTRLRATSTFHGARCNGTRKTWRNACISETDPPCCSRSNVLWNGSAARQCGAPKYRTAAPVPGIDVMWRGGVRLSITAARGRRSRSSIARTAFESNRQAALDTGATVGKSHGPRSRCSGCRNDNAIETALVADGESLVKIQDNLTTAAAGTAMAVARPRRPDEYDDLEGIAWRWQSIDGATMKAPLAQESVGPNPTDRGKKMVVVHRHGRQSP